MIESINQGHISNYRRPSRFRLLSPCELRELPRMAWVVQDVLPKEGIAVIYGDTKTGKSFLAIDLLVAIAEGRDWFGYQTEVVPATYIALEGQAGVSQRVHAVGVRRGEPSESFRVIVQDLSLANPADVDALGDCLLQSGRRDGVVIIDTLARAALGLDENSSKDMGLIINGANTLQKMVGGLVVLVHHTGKDGSKGPRGHSSFMAALDAAIRVDKKAKRRIWTLDKAKDAVDGKEHDFELEVVDMGVDDRNNPIATCVVVQVGAPKIARKSDQLPQGALQEFVWNAIKTEMEHTREWGNGGNSERVPGVHLARLIELGHKQLTNIESKRVKERVKDAVDGLMKRGLITWCDGYYWIPKTPENS
ncbi:MAG: AAA family ATPase [Betaproteobacteria bacterium]